ncbi:MAG TPA: hypothetical protein VHR66_25465 [Gemmataceae bacterium]|jgi:hypothetical protein|nr:hypothetical protein [Gemmataceae bacterium]
MAKRDGKASKADMVRDAIAKLGWAKGIDEYAAYIKETYGAEMTKAHISQTKSNERKRQGVRGPKRGRRGRPPGSGKKQMAAVAAVNGATAAATVADILAFVDTLRDFETKLGAASIREVIKTVLKK